ncbi:5'-3' exoribonuclease 3-like, partial [Trifolium medium]|nr:5'-3' exoribonuclease 3-like [Trifolium medium]
HRPAAVDFNQFAYVPNPTKTRRVAPDTRRVATDTHNTRKARPTAVDLNQYAYVPKQRLEE